MYVGLLSILSCSLSLLQPFSCCCCCCSCGGGCGCCCCCCAIGESWLHVLDRSCAQGRQGKHTASHRGPGLGSGTVPA